MKYFIGILLTIVLFIGTVQLVSAEGKVMSWTVDGVSRQAIVVEPSGGSKGAKSPVIFFFHGHGGRMAGPEEKLSFQSLWPEALAVYPQGLPTATQRDPNGNHPGWQKEKGDEGDRDLKFFDAMLTTLRKKYSIDDSKIYVSGFSNGAAFTYLLWSERGKDLAGFGICAGKMWPSDHPAKPLPAYIAAGQKDPINPFETQQESIESVRKIDGATGSGKNCGENCTLYSSTKQAPVMTLIHPGGHACPPWAASGMVNFFKAHPL